MSEQNKLAGSTKIWDDYWFYPSPLFSLALCRIIIVGFQFYYLLSRDYWHNVLARTDIPTINFSPLPIFQFLNYPFPWDNPPTFFLMFVLWGAFATCITSLLGLRTRLSLLVCAISNLYIQTYLYSFGQFHHGEAILLIALFLFALAPSGDALSIDDLNRRLRKNIKAKRFQAFSVVRGVSPYARWPLLVIQWLFSFIYFSAALNKVNLDGPGLFSAQWMNGYTLQYYLIRDGSQWGSDLGVWLGQYHIPAIISSWFAVLFEATFLLVIPFPKLIWVYIPLGVFLHIGIWMAQRAPFFNYLAVYSVFIPWTAVIKILSHQLTWTHQNKKAELFYHDLSDRVIRMLTVLSYFDWFQRVTYRNLKLHEPLLLEKQREMVSSGERPEDLLCVEPNGTVQEGFFALRRIVAYLPPLWPLLVLLYMPGMTIVGPKAYRLATAKR